MKIASSHDFPQCPYSHSSVGRVLRNLTPVVGFFTAFFNFFAKGAEGMCATRFENGAGGVVDPPLFSTTSSHLKGSAEES
jgi:hypothetical protein